MLSVGSALINDVISSVQVVCLPVSVLHICMINMPLSYWKDTFESHFHRMECVLFCESDF